MPPLPPKKLKPAEGTAAAKGTFTRTKGKGTNTERRDNVKVMELIKRYETNTNPKKELKGIIKTRVKTYETHSQKEVDPGCRKGQLKMKIRTKSGMDMGKNQNIRNYFRSINPSRGGGEDLDMCEGVGPVKKGCPKKS